MLPGRAIGGAGTIGQGPGRRSAGWQPPKSPRRPDGTGVAPMKKLLFFDYRELEYLDGFARAVEPPVKHPGAPLMTPDLPWEHGNMQLYGSVIQAADGQFRAWYEVCVPPFTTRLAYAESDDGLTWRKPELDTFSQDGRRTNIVFDAEQTSPALLEDREDPRPDWRYKMLMGAEPSRCIAAMHSADGIHWKPVRTLVGRVHPVITTNPDCPIGFLRAPDGRFAAYHRMDGYGRRVFRSESWDFVHWSGEPQHGAGTGRGRPAADAVLRTGGLRLRALRSWARCGSTRRIPATRDRRKCTGCKRRNWPMRGPARPGTERSRGRRSFQTATRASGTRAICSRPRSRSSWRTRSGTTTRGRTRGTPCAGKWSRRKRGWAWRG